MTPKRNRYNPKAHLRALNRKQGELSRIAPAVYVADTNHDYWIDLPVEITSACDAIVYRYSWEMESQPIAGVLVNLTPIESCHKQAVLTVIIKMLDQPGVEYSVSYRDVWQKGLDVDIEPPSAFRHRLVLVPMEYLEKQYRYPRRYNVER